MPEVYAEEYFEPARFMDPELAKAMPESFEDYIALHPELLPDYAPFASDVIDVVSRHPDRQVILFCQRIG